MKYEGLVKGVTLLSLENVTGVLDGSGLLEKYNLTQIRT